MEAKFTNTKDIERAVKSLLKSIGEDPEREGLKETPNRIARMFQEIFRGYDQNQKPKITTFANENHSEEMVFDSGDYYSMCEHHMMPFFGKYCIAYIPNKDGQILGISKIGRVVDYCAARLQLQERLAMNIVEMLEDALKCRYPEKGFVPAKGFAIMMKGKHLCKSMRGARKEGAMSVLYFTGQFKHDNDLKKQFIEMAKTMVD